MEADAWSDWAGGAPEAPAAVPGVRAPELDDLHERVVTWAARLVGTRDALLWLVEDGRRLAVRKGIGRFAGCVGRRLGKGEGLAGEAWRTGMPQGGGQGEVAAALCVPLIADGSVVGVLGMAWSEPGRVVGQAEMGQLRGGAGLAGVAIDRAGRLAAGPGPASRPGWLPGADERYRTLSEQIPAVLYSEVHTPEGALVYESPQGRQLLGYTIEEIMAPDFWMTLIHPDDRERVLAENQRVDRTGDPWNVEYRVFARDSQVIWVRDHAVLVRGEDGEPDYWQGYYIDITDQKLAEESLRLALERERQAARELRALDELKNTFLDAVSHELRTPLATVIGIALTLKRAGPAWTRRTPPTWSTGWPPTPASWTGSSPTCWTSTGSARGWWSRAAAAPTSPRSSAGSPPSGASAAGGGWT
jgi:PAS domain S-box-containing protein